MSPIDHSASIENPSVCSEVPSLHRPETDFDAELADFRPNPPPSVGNVRKSAWISDCGLYRYRLERTWDPGCERVGFIMLNPSTADGEVDDPTIRRCIGFARSWGYGGIVVNNLFAYRATKPSELRDALGAGINVTGPENYVELERTIEHAPLIVCAWGGYTGIPRLRIEAMAAKHGRRLHCLGTTRSGAPRHPLYLAAKTPLQPYGAST